MKKTVIETSFLILIFSGCLTEKKTEEKEAYLRWIGDIEQNNELDDPNFKACNGDEKIFQYFNLGEGPTYKGEKSKILKTFNTKFKPQADQTQNGFIRIRFVVNCEGKAGRFRVLQSDYNYEEFQFDKSIVSQLVEITKGIQEWEIMYGDAVPVDYYFYLIFKINDGQLTEILP